MRLGSNDVCGNRSGGARRGEVGSTDMGGVRVSSNDVGGVRLDMGGRG